jgi:AraC-like DNA-binding protein
MHTIVDFLHEAKRGIQFVRRTGKSLINKIEQLTTIKGMNRLIGLLSVLDIMSTTGDIIYLSSPGYKPRIINSEDKERMEIIFRYVNQEYSNKICLKKISSLVHLTSPSFCRYFKSRTNKVFSTFVNEVRINNSCKMLIQNKFTIAEVCFASGFNYLSNFNRQFRRIKGLTPSEYQSKYRNLI